MSAYKTILIAIDLNGNPEQVLARAKPIVSDQGSTIHVLNVCADPEYLYMAYPVYAGHTLDFDLTGQRDSAREKMNSLVTEADLSEANIIAKTGSATNIILDHAEELGADLIIMGSHGRRGVRLLLGSTANGVLHRAKCDVLAVRISEAK
ncbi:MAG: universal stress protein A [Halioglobus sp.]|jgi:universal stress protein A